MNDSDMLTVDQAEDILGKYYHYVLRNNDGGWKIMFDKPDETVCVASGTTRYEVVHVVYTELYYGVLKEILLNQQQTYFIPA